jgi:hypothetical protein
VSKEIDHIKKSTQNLLYSLKEKKLNVFIREKQTQLKTANEEETQTLMNDILHLNTLKRRVNKLLGRIVVK